MRVYSLLIATALLTVSGLANGALISGTTSDGANKDLESLFNDEWLTSGAAMDVNAEARTPGLWQIGASGGAFSKIIIEVAGHSSINNFGLYDRNDPDNRLAVFSGSDGAGESRTIEYKGGGVFEAYGAGTPVETANLGSATFGFYLRNSENGDLFLSESARNPDGATQMVGFEGDGNREADFHGSGASTWLTNEWVLAWEDLPYGTSDRDFNDFVGVVESVYPVPAPGMLGLLGLGLIGLGVVGRGRRQGRPLAG
jgi:hypothetical protein